MDFAQGGGHEDADDDQGRSCDLGRDDGQERGENHTEGEEDGDDDGRETRAGTDCNAGRGFDVGCRRRRAHDGTAEHGEGVGHECAADARHFAVAHDAGLLCQSDERTSRIEESDEEEDDDHGPHLRIREDGCHVADAHAKRRVKTRCHGDDAFRRRDDLGHETHDGRQDNAVEDGARHFLGHEDGRHEQAEDGEPGRRHFERTDGDQGRRIRDDDATALQADKGDEDADTGSHCVFQILGDGINDDLADFEQGNQREQDGSDENTAHSLLPGDTHGQYDGIREESIVTEPRCDGDGVVGQEAHEQAAHDGRKSRGREDGTGIHAGIAEDDRIDKENVSHGDKRRQACQAFALDRGVVFRQVEESVQDSGGLVRHENKYLLLCYT